MEGEGTPLLLYVNIYLPAFLFETFRFCVFWAGLLTLVSGQWTGNSIMSPLEPSQNILNLKVLSASTI